MRIPRIGIGNTQMEVNSPKVRVDQAGSDARGIQAIGGAVEKTADFMYQKMDEARNYTEAAQAELYTTRKMADLLVKADTDTYTSPDGKVRLKTGKADDFRPYDEEISKGRQEVGKFFTNKEQQAKFMAEYDKSAIVARNALQNKFMKNAISEGRATINETVDTHIQNYSLNADPSFRKAEKATIENVYNNAVRLGYLEADPAYTQKEEALKKMQNRAFIADAQRDREDAKKRLESGEYGFDSKEMDTALSTLVHYKELEDKNTLLNKIDSRYEIVNAIATGKEDLYNLSPKAQMFIENDDILAEAVSKATQSKKGYYADTQNEGIVKVFDEASKTTNREDLSNLAVSLIYRTKDISPDKLGAALFYAQQKAVTLKLSEKEISPIGDETTEAEIKQKQIDAGINSISRWAKELMVTPDQHGQVITEYMKAIQKGDTPYNSVNSIIRNTNLSLHPEMINYPKEGQLVSDSQGNLKMAFPTGELKPIEAKVKKVTTSTDNSTKSKEIGFDELKRK